jgi:hypothetical protein
VERTEVEMLYAFLNEHEVEILGHIKEYVKNIWSQGTFFHPYYTLHGPQHAEQVESIIANILAPEHDNKIHSVKNIVDHVELFYLFCSAWLHDVGMIAPLSESEEADIAQQEESKEDWLRKEHHNRSRDYIEKYWKDLKLDTMEDAQYIGIICQAHRGVSLGVDERLMIDHPDLRLLSAILRVADGLDITQKRTPNELLELRWKEMDEQAKWHWLKHYCVKQAKPVHLERIDEKPPILMLTYHYTIGLPSHEFAEAFWERIIRPIREVVEYEGVESILLQKGLSIGHKYFMKNIWLNDPVLPDGKMTSDYISEFFVPQKLISSELYIALNRIGWLNPAASEILKAQCEKVLSVTLKIYQPKRIEDAVDKLLDKLSTTTNLSQIENARDDFKKVFREIHRSAATSPLIISELHTEADKLADLGWRLMAYIHSPNQNEIREMHIRHLWAWLGKEIDLIFKWVVRHDTSASLKIFILSKLADTGDLYYQVVVETIKDPDATVRLEAVKALGLLHGPDLHMILDNLSYSDPDVKVREEAFKILHSQNGINTNI